MLMKICFDLVMNQIFNKYIGKLVKIKKWLIFGKSQLSMGKFRINEEIVENVNWIIIRFGGLF